MTNSSINLNLLQYSWAATVRLQNGQEIDIWYTAWPMTRSIVSDVLRVYTYLPKFKIKS